MRKNYKGITLIALIITIIVLLILAGVSISALVGDNGIITQAMKSKGKTEEASAKEELQLAWMARMSKFYEELANGTVTYDQIEQFFSVEKLNECILGGGRVLTNSYNPSDETFTISYTSSHGINFTARIKSSGEIVSFEKLEDNEENNLEYTEVWVSYYEDTEGKGVLTYASNKDLRDPAMPAGADSGAKWKQWDITDGLYRNSKSFSIESNIPWCREKVAFQTMNGHTSTYTVREGEYSNVYTVKILDEIVPTSTDFLFYYLNKITTIEYFDRVKTKVIGKSMFSFCNELSSITISDIVTDIEVGAFVDCYQITSLTIPNKVTNIGQRAFSRSGLTSIIIPNSVESIGNAAFVDCYHLVNVTISNKITNIGDSAFMDCSSLVSVNIPSSVTTIERYAFYNCPNLATVNYTGTEEQWNDISIGIDNTPLVNATMVYNYTGN